MQKSSKFLISDLISDQSALYVPRPVISQEYSNGFLTVPNTTDLLDKNKDKSQTNQINELLYTQLQKTILNH